MFKTLFVTTAVLFLHCFALAQTTPFEKSNGLQTATYFEVIDFYTALAKKNKNLTIKAFGQTDAGYPLHLVTIGSQTKPIKTNNQTVILVNNGIHPGEPDGIDASMLLARDIVQNKIILPPNITLAIIPVYNIGGCLNRGTTSRANQNGPLAYGFRGNAQNLDLNRDFTKADSKEAAIFAQIFTALNPDIFIDNHVSDGADYQHTFTLLTTQYEKLGSILGTFLKNIFEPAVYTGMKTKGWDVFPYVNFETDLPENGMTMFYDPPRYSSGYAALFGTIAFVPETHMLKPFKDRVLSTYHFMQTTIETASQLAPQIKIARKQQLQLTNNATTLPLTFTPDTTTHTLVNFMGYQAQTKTSIVTQLPRMFYNRNLPFTKAIKYFNTFTPTNYVAVPKAYFIPQGYSAVITNLKNSGVIVTQFLHDTIINVTVTKITDYKSLPKPYEKHHKNYAVKTTTNTQAMRFLKGDYIIPTQQTKRRFIVEMLEPTGEDSYFAWNYFDGILQQKEGYSDYRWEDVAEEILKNNPTLQAALAEKRKDPKFAANSSAQLDFIYKNSAYYEPTHNRYPVFKLF
jgi:hypothetical protein